LLTTREKVRGQQEDQVLTDDAAVHTRTHTSDVQAGSFPDLSGLGRLLLVDARSARRSPKPATMVT
jgi:hypothetical protein